MKVTNVEKKENSTVELTIHVEADEFEAAVQKAYLKSRSRIAVPGFRKGKAPRKIIEGMYGSGVFYEDAINDVYPGAYEAAVKEQGLEDMGHPVMDIVEVNKEKGLIFTALVSVRPEAKVKAYKGLTAPKAEVSVTDEDVENEIKRGMVICHPGQVKEHSKFKAEVYILKKEEGGRHTPFHNKYRPQFYIRTLDVTGEITLPEGTEMVMPGDNVTIEVELIYPVACSVGLRFAIREGGRTVGAGQITELEN